MKPLSAAPVYSALTSNCLKPKVSWTEGEIEATYVKTWEVLSYIQLKVKKKKRARELMCVRLTI